jgi:MerR family redox-sensitive transcriptional activator SoxR
VKGELLSIGEISAATGLRPSALRYYEEVGLITPSARIAGRRHYHRAVLRRLAIVALCQEAEFTVAEIAQLLRQDRRSRERWRTFTERKLVEVKDHIQRANATKRLLEQVLACGCGDPAGCEMVQEAAGRRLLQISGPSIRRSELPKSR